MGGLPDEGGVTRRGDEGPVHEVYLDSLYVDIYEVSNRLYDAYVALGGGQASRSKSPRGSRVIRGGSYGMDAYPFGSVTGRNSNDPSTGSWNVGIRCASDGRNLIATVEAIYWSIAKRQIRDAQSRLTPQSP